MESGCQPDIGLAGEALLDEVLAGFSGRLLARGEQIAGEAGTQPPNGNTGANLTPSLLEGVSACIDTFTVVFRDQLDARHVAGLLFRRRAGDDPIAWEERGCGGHFYTRSLWHGEVKLLFGGREDMGVCLQMGAGAMAQCEAEGWVGPNGWPRFLQACLDLGGRFSRCDTALDDRAGVLSMEQIGASLDGWELTGSARESGHIVKRTKGGKLKGETYTIGARTSEAFIRIYNKAAERGEEGHWVRVEAEWKGAKAQQVAELLAHECGLRPIAGLIRGVLQFRTPTGKGERRDRWAVAEWWERFLGAAEKIALTSAPVARTLDTVANWLFRQVAPSLALMQAAPGYGLQWIAQTIEAGEDRLKLHHHTMLLGAAT